MTRTVIIGPPPTSNGDLHVGHIAGPYLAADVYARYLRANGRPVIYTTGTDDSQTYVVTSAARLGTTPAELARRSWYEIGASLDAAGIAVDGYAPFDDGYRASVVDFTTRLYRSGKFELRTVRLPWSTRTNQFLVEGLVSGGCPVCLAVSRGGLCESCGHPNNFDELIDPWSTVDPDDKLVSRETRLLVLPLERYRQRIEHFYARTLGSTRPRLRQLMRELLVRPLPDFPITYPTDWGIPAPFPETPGQVFNAWVEGMPASMYCTAVAQRNLGERPANDDELWLATHDIRLTYFLGFDNAYFWGVAHLALLMAHDGRYVLPDAIICNEFYELENEKFSTSKGHVVWTRDLLAEVPRDLVRYYLALTAPEHSRTNFARTALERITRTRLVDPWNSLATILNKAAAEFDGELPVSDAARARCAAMTARFATCYELPSFSMSRAADLIVLHIGRLLDAALALPPQIDDPSGVGDLLAEVHALLDAASPILIDLAEQAKSGGTIPMLSDRQEWQCASP